MIKAFVLVSVIILGVFSITSSADAAGFGLSTLIDSEVEVTANGDLSTLTDTVSEVTKQVTSTSEKATIDVETDSQINGSSVEHKTQTKASAKADVDSTTSFLEKAMASTLKGFKSIFSTNVKAESKVKIDAEECTSSQQKGVTEGEHHVSVQAESNESLKISIVSFFADMKNNITNVLQQVAQVNIHTETEVENQSTVKVN
jgi:hypothetical protein